MREGLACSRLASPPATGVRSDSKEVCTAQSRSVLHARHNNRERSDRKRRCVRMKVLIGVDPHKASIAVAVVDEVVGELVECATFLQNRAGLRALERWAKRFPERRWAVENAGGLGVGTWPRCCLRLASRWWTWRPSFQRGCRCSLASLATPARTMSWTPSPPRW